MVASPHHPAAVMMPTEDHDHDPALVVEAVVKDIELEELKKRNKRRYGSRGSYGSTDL